MQANRWADVLTTTPKTSGDALRALLAACVTSAFVAAGTSSALQQRPFAYRQQRQRSADARPNAQRPYAHPR